MYSHQHYEAAQQQLQLAKDEAAKAFGSEEYDAEDAFFLMRPYLALAEVHAKLAEVAMKAEADLGVKGDYTAIIEAWTEALDDGSDLPDD